MTTVLTIEPLDFQLLGNTIVHNFKGEVTKGKTVVPVDYPASLSPKSIDKGVFALDDLLRSVSGEVLVFAHSQGAQVVSRWLRAHSTIDPASPQPSLVSFLLIGNLLRKYGGAGVGAKEVDGKIGIPTPNDTPYSVTDVKIQGDGWADDPGENANFWARMNATKGKHSRHCFGYRTADLNDPGRKTYQENTTQYVMIPAKPNIPVPESWIESSYRRPEC